MSTGTTKQGRQHERSPGSCISDRVLGTSPQFCVHRTRETETTQERELTGSEARRVGQEQAGKGFQRRAVGRHLSSCLW